MVVQAHINSVKLAVTEDIELKKRKKNNRPGNLRTRLPKIQKVLGEYPSAFPGFDSCPRQDVPQTLPHVAVAMTPMVPLTQPLWRGKKGTRRGEDKNGINFSGNFVAYWLALIISTSMIKLRTKSKYLVEGQHFARLLFDPVMA